MTAGWLAEGRLPQAAALLPVIPAEACGSLLPTTQGPGWRAREARGTVTGAGQAQPLQETAGVLGTEIPANVEQSTV